MEKKRNLISTRVTEIVAMSVGSAIQTKTFESSTGVLSTEMLSWKTSEEHVEIGNSALLQDSLHVKHTSTKETEYLAFIRHSLGFFSMIHIILFDYLIVLYGLL